MLLVVMILLADLTSAVPTTPSQRVDAPDRVTIHVVQRSEDVEEASLDIRRTATGFSDGKRAIAEPLLRALVAAATAPPPPRLDVARLGVDPVALRRAAEQAPKKLSPRTAARFVERVCDPKNLPELATSMLQQTWNHDEPSVELDLTLHDGEHLFLRTGALGPFMLPWQVIRGGRSLDSYDPDLARAVAALLPPKFLNRSRMNGDHLHERLADVAAMRWRSDLNRATADEQYGADLAPLRARFDVSNEHVAFIYGFNASGDRVWNGHLTDPTDPRVGFDLWLTASADHLASTAPFLRDATPLMRRVRSIPWIARYLKSHLNASIRIEYRDDRSLGSTAQKSIGDNLRREDQAKLAAAVAGLLDRSVGLYIEEDNRFSIWILLPDDRAFLTYGLVPMAPGLPDDRVGVIVGPDGASIEHP